MRNPSVGLNYRKKSDSTMRTALNRFLNIGIKQEYQPWEIFLTRKLNFITLIAIFNMSMALIFFILMGYEQFVVHCVWPLLAAPIVILLNRFKNYVWSAYAFNIIGFVFFFFINLAEGIHSYASVFYFPVIISLVQLLGRRETIKHLIIIGVLGFISIVLIAFGLKYQWMPQLVNPETEVNLAVFNIILGMFTAITFIVAVVKESLSQERLIKSMLTEKEILLAEVFHRVKNNMNIVTSLLNLKKNSSDSFEVREALEECRSRVYSMALVHQKVFNNKNVVSLNFKEYANDLVNDIINSLNGTKSVKTKLEMDDVFLELSNAIPCGLILNELITNSYKYAGQNGKPIEIEITLKSIGENVELQVRDNGPGIEKGGQNKPNSLGIELIKSLADQISAESSFTNQNGLVFNMKFKQ
ncbi:MAG: sensor histidine kinase [Bacteroidia bacterium]|nr:sensor histidine kinase [Bacteroidia bacterium]